MPSDVGQRLPWTFPLSTHYWRPRCAGKPGASGAADASSAARGTSGARAGAGSADEAEAGQAVDAAVRIRGLRKVFHTTDGMEKVRRGYAAGQVSKGARVRERRARLNHACSPLPPLLQTGRHCSDPLLA